MTNPDPTLFIFENTHDYFSNKEPKKIDFIDILKKTTSAIILRDTFTEPNRLLNQISSFYKESVTLTDNDLQSGKSFSELVSGPSYKKAEKSSWGAILITTTLTAKGNVRIVTDIQRFIDNYPNQPIFIECSSDFFNQKQYYWKIAVITGGHLPTKQTDSPKKENGKTTFIQSILTFSGNIFAGGSTWNAKTDYKDKFWSEKIWDSETTSFNKIIHKAQKGDVLILKSTTPFLNTNTVQIRGFGIIEEVLSEGSRLKVDWFLETENVMIAGEGKKFSKRFSEVDRTSFQIILDHLPSDVLEQLHSKLFPTDIPKPSTFLSTYVNNDSSESANDELNFERDTKALAALVALKEMTPPLAIALFGRWGSGKSFFMGKMEKYIKELSENQGFLEKDTSGKTENTSEKQLFVKGIAHIRFNAWSYLDSNLWAGLSHSLFEKLNEYITDNTKGNAQRLAVKTEITTRIQASENSVLQLQKKEGELSLLKLELDDELKKQQSLLRKLVKFLPKFDQILISAGKGSKNSPLTKQEINSAMENGKTIGAFIKRDWLWNSIYVAAAIGIIIVCQKTIFPYLEDIAEKIALFLLSGSVPAIPVIRFFSSKSTISKMEVLIKDLSFSDSNEAIILTNEREKIEKEIVLIEQSKKTVERNLELDRQKLANLNQETIKTFIKNTSSSEHYTKHLGIISSLRKDFETLSELFYEENGDSEKVSNQNNTIIDANYFQENKRLERIILYIDDLDRCSDEKIMEVLEAVHLLMAFKLFIVVVGVDERSVHNALMNRRLERYRGIDSTIVEKHIEAVEPHEYLEKIFQIPFQIPEPKTDHVHRFINSLLPETKTDSSTTDETPDDSSLPENNVFGYNPAVEPEEREERYGLSAPNLDEPATNYDSLPANEPKPSPAILRPVIPTDVEISKKEKIYLRDFSILIGTNPRALKRFINIFRIAKVYETSDSEEVSRKLVFLIAFFTGKFDHIAYEWMQHKNAQIHQMSSNEPEFHEMLTKLRDNKENGNDYSLLINQTAADYKDEIPIVQRFSYVMGQTRKEKSSEAIQETKK